MKVNPVAYASLIWHSASTMTTKYKTMHVPEGIHVKLRKLSRKLKIPMTDLLDRMADSTERARQKLEKVA